MQRAAPEFVVKRDRDGRAPLVSSLLHHGVAATLADPLKAILLENATNSLAGQRAKLTQP
jgi:hypothetical protein